MFSPQVSNKRKYDRKKHPRSRSPKRTRSSVKGGRHSLALDNSYRYSLENKIKHSSRHASPQISHHHRKHKKASPTRRKVWQSEIQISITQNLQLA